MAPSMKLFIIALVFLLVGCTTHQNTTPTKNFSAESPAVALSEAAVSVSRSLNELAAIEMASTPRVRTLSNPTPQELPGLVSIDWTGPIEPLLHRIAAISGYRLRVLGRQPAIPPIITITAKKQPLSSVVRDIDFQASKKASIMVYPRMRIIELQYMRA